MDKHPPEADAATGVCRCGLPAANLRAHILKPPAAPTPGLAVPAQRAPTSGALRAAPSVARSTAAPARLDGPATSHAAARAADAFTGTLRGQVLTLIATSPATDDEIERTLQRAHTSVSSARNHLAREQLIEPLHEDGEPVYRATRAGRHAQVWTVTDRGRAHLPTLTGGAR